MDKIEENEMISGEKKGLSQQQARHAGLSGGNPIFLVPLFLVNLASPTGTLGQESLRTCKNIHPPGCHKGSLLPCREFMSTPAGGLHWPRAFLLPQRTQWLHPEAEDRRRTGSHLEGTGPPS